MQSIVHTVTSWITASISSLGYSGIVVLMAIGCACVPLPSEIVMAYGGYLVFKDPARFDVWLMGLAGTVGCVLGSVVAYWAGKYGGRPFVERYGRYILIRHKDLDRADAFFARHGDTAVFVSRLLPIVRAYISFPAGISETRFGRFVIYTFLGSLPWCLGFAWLGKILGGQWETKLRPYFHRADAVIAAAILILIALYIYHHVKSDVEYK